MFGKSRRERLQESGAAASALAAALAQDKKFRKRLISAIAHGAEAGRRTRRGLGVGGAVVRLATDQKLLNELGSARSDLRQAYARLESKRRGHKLRKLFVLAGLATVAGVPTVRARVWAGLSGLSRRFGLAGTANHRATGRSGNSTRPNRLEDLSKEQLYARAQTADIPGRSEMSKEQLIEALRAHS